MQFRKDINALRAIAVLSVVIFHFQPELLPGGFVGVDIFFVISGYLMTMIIMNGIKENTFNILYFYKARLVRIVPALTFMCFVILFIGFFYLLPKDYEYVGRHVRDSISFISNETYLKEAGYFDQEAKSKWLLHTWSLSVEWQFYLIYPLLLVGVLKTVFKEYVSQVLIILTLVSFSLCSYLGHKDPNSVYYLLSARAWELLIGSFAYIYSFGKGNRAIGYTGWTLIAVSILLIDSTLVWPSMYSLIPTIGCLLVIMSGRSGIIVENKLIQRTGLYSYSIYLWHWPIVVLFNYLGLHDSWIFVGMGVSLVLGMLSYYLIEPLGKKERVLLPIFISMVVVYVFAAIVRIDGAPNRWVLTQEVRDIYSQILETPRKECSKREPKDACRLFSEEPTWVVWGDSHSYELAYSLGKALEPFRDGVIEYSKSSCPMILNPENKAYKKDCAEWRKKVIDEILKNNKIKNVVMINRYNSTLYGSNEKYYPKLPDLNDKKHREEIYSDIEYVIQQFSKSGKTVWLISGIPEMGRDIYALIGKRYIEGGSLENIIANERSYQNARNNLTYQTLKRFSKSMSNVNFVDVNDIYCDSSYCYGVRSGQPLYRDDDHPNLIASDLISREIINAAKL